VLIAILRSIDEMNLLEMLSEPVSPFSMSQNLSVSTFCALKKDLPFSVLSPILKRISVTFSSPLSLAPGAEKTATLLWGFEAMMEAAFLNPLE